MGVSVPKMHQCIQGFLMRNWHDHRLDYPSLQVDRLLIFNSLDNLVSQPMIPGGTKRCPRSWLMRIMWRPQNMLRFIFRIYQMVLLCAHYDDVIMTMLASQITSLLVVYSIVYSGVNKRKHQSSASLAFVREIHRGPVNFPHKWPVTRKMFPFDDVIMIWFIDAYSSGLPNGYLDKGKILITLV